MTLYFSYGSNMSNAEMAAFAPEHRFVGPARLPGHRVELRRRSIRWGAGVADVVAAPGGEVWGALYELRGDALDRLDVKEGEGFAYRRREVAVELRSERLAAWLYEVIDKEPESVPCRPDYRELLVAAARARGLPDDYVAALSGLPVAAAT